MIPTQVQNYILPFIQKQNLDIRSHKDGRWIDQKCTPDVVMLICDCIIDLLKDYSTSFTTNDVWNSTYFNQSVKDFFSKPDVNEMTAKNEYDKFISQPLKMLARAGILHQEKLGQQINFSVSNPDMLNFISSTEKHTLYFIYLYVMETFEQSNFMHYIENFKSNNIKSEFCMLKSAFENLIINNTPINGKRPSHNSQIIT